MLPILLASTLLSASSLAQPTMTLEPMPIRTLVITGRNNHNWQYTSRVHADTLAATGRFTVDITDDPATTLADAAAAGKYQLFVLDYNDWDAAKRWGDAAEKNFVSAVNGGAGVLAIHSANNAFKGWKDYESMLGLMWRDGTGHGPVHEFTVNIVEPTHPVFAGLPAGFTTTDELYYKLVNSQNAKYRLLAQAMDKAPPDGSGKNEPMAFTLDFGKGRVFATPLGHVWVDAIETKSSVTSPAFKTLISRGGEWAATGAVTLPAEWKDVRAHNTLTDQEKSDGWKLLFDGKTSKNFRGFKKDNFPDKGWVVRDGMLIHEKDGGGGDVVTDDEYTDFEFSCQWRVTPGANSGIIYHSTEDHNYPWETGPEMQILDDAKHADGKNKLTRAGTLYAIVPAAFDVCRPAGEWNEARVKCVGSKVEHWLNGFKVVDIDIAGDDYIKARDASKFKAMKDYNTKTKGHIALQDHGDEVAFRDIKVRVIGGK
ncbi:MAG: family 16 glycoside hydrolase [Phycisphaerales bacterium]